MIALSTGVCASSLPLIRLPAPSPRDDGEKDASRTVAARASSTMNGMAGRASTISSPRPVYGERVRVRGNHELRQPMKGATA
jgi:hypothetical protein